MNVLYSAVGNQHYIADLGSGDIGVFDSFGKGLGFNGAIGSMKRTAKVDVLSIVDRGNKRQCEIMFQGKKLLVNERLFSCVSSVRSLGGYIGTMFYAQHKDEDGEYTQVLFLYNTNAMTFYSIDSVVKGFALGDWQNL